MSGFFNFLRCLARVVIKNGARVLARLVPFGEAAFEIARDAHEEYRKVHVLAELRAELEAKDPSLPAEVETTVKKVATGKTDGQLITASLPLISIFDQGQAAVPPPQVLHRGDAESEKVKEMPPKEAPIVLKSPKRTYTLLNQLGRGDGSDVYLASGRNDLRTAAETYYTLTVSRAGEGQALLDNERLALSGLLDAAGDSTYRKYLPTLADSFMVNDKPSKRVNGFLYEPGQYTLEQVHDQHPVLDARHLAWIFKRLLTVLGFSHRQGKVHGAVLPCHVLIHAANHGLQLVDWGQSVQTGRPIRTLSARYRDWYPAEVRENRPAGPPTDLFMAARCLIYLAGGDPVSDRMPDTVPAPMRRFIETCLLPGMRMRPNDAWKLQEELDELLGRLYGAPMFHPLTMT